MPTPIEIYLVEKLDWEALLELIRLSPAAPEDKKRLVRRWAEWKGITPTAEDYAKAGCEIAEEER
jgi:hypothetical protein